MSAVDVREAQRPLGTHVSRYPSDYELVVGSLSGQHRAVLKGGPWRTAEGIEMQSREDAIALRDALIQLVLDWPVGSPVDCDTAEREHNGSRRDC